MPITSVNENSKSHIPKIEIWVTWKILSMQFPTTNAVSYKCHA